MNLVVSPWANNSAWWWRGLKFSKRENKNGLWVYSVTHVMAYWFSCMSKLKRFTFIFGVHNNPLYFIINNTIILIIIVNTLAVMFSFSHWAMMLSKKGELTYSRSLASNNWTVCGMVTSESCKYLNNSEIKSHKLLLYTLWRRSLWVP